MPLDKEMLIEQYRQCNEHLRSSDNKRDVIFGFYATISAALLGFSAALKPTNTPSDTISTLILFGYGFVGLTLIGFAIGLIFTMYRIWHGFYVIQAIALQAMVHNIHSRIGDEFVKDIDFDFQRIRSVEFGMFLLLHDVIFLNLVATTVIFRSIYVIIIWVIFFGEGISHIGAMWFFDREKRNGKLGTRYLWMLQSTVRNWPPRPIVTGGLHKTRKNRKSR